MDGATTPSSARRELNQKFDALSIFKRDRASALYHFCVVVEMSTNPYTVDPDLVMAMGRRVLEASMRAIPGIYRNCPAVSAASMVQFRRGIISRESLERGLSFLLFIVPPQAHRTAHAENMPSVHRRFLGWVAGILFKRGRGVGRGCAVLLRGYS